MKHFAIFMAFMVGGYLCLLGFTNWETFSLLLQ